MGKLLLIFFGGFLLLTIPVPGEAQIWPFNKRSQAEKAEKDLQERRRQAGQGNMFNAMQPWGSRFNDVRDDYIWGAPTARSSYHNAGNFGFSGASRYGLKPGVELLSWLGVAYWIPNLFVKREISRGKWWVSSLHGAYSASPGFKHVYKNRNTFLADSLSGVPGVLAIKNQLLLSRPFYSRVDCNPDHPYLVFSASLAFDYGFSLGREQRYIPERHLFTPRSRPYSGEGWLITAGIRADWEVNPDLYLRGVIRSLAGDFTSGVAVEQHSMAELFLLRGLSLSGGYIMGYGKFGTGNFSIWPFLDISIYFGRKQGRNRGLFGQQMF